MPKGLFIAFEGGDGCGKTTQLQLLAERLRAQGQEVVITKEPGSPHLPFNQKLRELILAPGFRKEASKLSEVALFLADRANHIEKLVKPSLEEGKIVISDRSEGSMIIYQGFVQKILETADLRFMNKIFTQGQEPDLTFWIDVPCELSLQRLKNERAQEETRFDKAEAAFHEEVRKGFLELSQSEKWRQIEGCGTREEVAERVWEEWEKFCGGE